MNKENLKKAINTIKVPQKDLQQAVNIGVSKAKKEEQVYQGSSYFKLGKLLLCATVVLLIASGVFIPSVNQVFAQVPIFGSLFEKFNDPLGIEIGKKTNEDERTAENRDNNARVLGAYYDTGQIGVIYQIKNKIAEDFEELEIYINDKKVSDTSLSFDFEKNEEKEIYDGYLSISLNQKELPEIVDLIAIFKSKSGETEKIEMPITKSKNEDITANVASEINTENGLYEAKVLKMVKGEASTLVEYQVTQPKGTVGAAYADFYVYDDNDKEYPIDKIFSSLLVSSVSDDKNDVSIFRAMLPNQFMKKQLSINITIVSKNIYKFSGAINEKLPKKIDAEMYTVSIDKITENNTSIVSELHLPELPRDFNKDILMTYLMGVSIGTKAYIETEEPDFKRMETPNEFYIKGAQVEKLFYEEGNGWSATIKHEKKETHGWGKYFDKATFDNKRAYYVGKFGPPNVTLPPMLIPIK
ncbi:DUF4179 domain-containing protein [Enterococcus sp. AZ196]|uniref:DUF4179 domain-containing protein n=1 Tax=Enterococcus sp. AZ196 TaxID=2774659 RepID=UPI003D2BAA83